MCRYIEFLRFYLINVYWSRISSYFLIVLNNINSEKQIMSSISLVILPEQIQ
jgi:hypothetical protein